MITFRMRTQNPNRIIPGVEVEVPSRSEEILLAQDRGVGSQIEEELMLIIYGQLLISYKASQPRALNPCQVNTVMCRRAW